MRDTGLREKILVAVGPSPHSEALLRRASALARTLSADWIALHVDTGKTTREDERARVEERLAQARALGGETAVVSATDIAERVILEAKKRSCGIILVGRSGLSAMGPIPRRSTLSDRIARLAGPIDVLVTQDSSARRGDITLRRIRSMFEAGPRQYLLLVSSFLILLAGGRGLSDLIGYRSVALVYLAAVILLSLVARPALVAIFAIASATALNFFLIPPFFTLRISLVEDTVLFAVYFFAAFVTSALVSGVRSNERLLRQNERRATFLAESLQELASSKSVEEAGAKAANMASTHFLRGVAVFIMRMDGGIPAEPLSCAGFSAGEAVPDPSVLSALVAARLAGKSPFPYRSGRFQVVPATTGSICPGAIVVIGDSSFSRSDADLLTALGRALALVIDRVQGESAARKGEMAIESERLTRILLDTVSHELRTPLTSITGAVSALSDEALIPDGATRKALLKDALSSADRLNAVVDDLLSASRIGSGMLKLKTAMTDLGEIADAVRRAASVETAGRNVSVLYDESTSSISVDLALIGRLGANLLKNAARYSRPGGGIELRLAVDRGVFRLEVADEGPGMPPEACRPPFRRFGRMPRQGGGLGLGLPICEGIAAAHGGSIEIMMNDSRCFRIAAVIPLDGAGGRQE